MKQRGIRAQTVRFFQRHPDPAVDPADILRLARRQAGTIRAFRLQQLDDRLLRHPAQIEAAMMQAMAVILTSAGFTVQDADDDYRPTTCG